MKFELNAYLEGRNKQAASKGRALAPILGGTTSRPPLKRSLMCGPRCCWGGPGRAVGDKRLSGGPLTLAVPREMSEEPAGWQTSRCALKKPWRLAGANPNLCRRQISPGFLWRPHAPLASNKPDAERTSTWPFVNPGSQRGNLDPITLTRAPSENRFSKNMFRERNGCEAGSQIDKASLMFGSLSLGQFFAPQVQTTNSFFL